MADLAVAPDPWASFRAGAASDAIAQLQAPDDAEGPNADGTLHMTIRPPGAVDNAAPPAAANDSGFQLPQEGDLDAGMVVTVRPPAQSGDKTGDSQAPGPTNDKADPWGAFRAAAAAVPQNDLQHADQPPSATVVSMLGNAAAGANRTIAGAIGLPVDLTNKALGAIPVVGKYLSSPNPVGGSGSIDAIQGVLSGGIKPSQIQPRNTAERAAAAGGAAAASLPMLALGGAGVAALPEEAATGLTTPFAQTGAAAQAGRQVQQVGGLLAKSMPLSGARAATQGLVTAGVGGAVGSALADQTDNPFLKPFLELGGNVLGGGLAHMAGEGANAVGRAAVRAAEPFTANGRVQAAGRQITNAMENPQASSQAIAEGVPGEGALPGQTYSTGQLTGDQGLQDLEQQAIQRQPQQAKALAAQQQETRANFIDTNPLLGARGGDIGAPQSFVTQRLAQIDQAADAALDAHRQRVAASVDTLGGTGSAQGNGLAMRGGLEEANQSSKQAVKGLFDAIGPFDVQTTGLAKEAQRIYDTVNPQAGDKLEPAEQSVLLPATGYSGFMPSETMQGLRSNTSAAIRQLGLQYGYDSRPVARMMQLKGAIDRAIDDTVAGRAEEDQSAVTAGSLAPEDTFEQQAQHKVANWLADRYGSGNPSNPDRSANSRSGSGGVSGMAGAGKPPGGKSTAGEGVPQPAAETQSEPQPITAEQQEAYDAARAGHAERKQTFGQGPVGNVLAPGRNGAPYRVLDSDVPAQFFNSSNRSPEAIQRFLKAAGGRVEAMQALQDYAAASMRKYAIGEDGTVNPTALDNWTRRHGAALDAFPDLKSKITSVRQAQDFLDQAQASAVAERKAFETGVVKSLLKTEDPMDALKKALGATQQGSTFGDMVDLVRGNNAASKGLSRLVVQYIRGNMGVGDDAFGTAFRDPVKFQRFLSDNAVPLKRLLGGQGFQNLQMVAADMRRTFRMTSGEDIKTGRTVDDIAAHGSGGRIGESNSLLGAVVAGEGAGAIAEGMLHGSTGGHSVILKSAAKVGAGVAAIMRKAGLNKTQDLVDEAMLHPEIARDVLARYKGATPSPILTKRLGARLQSIMAAETGAHVFGGRQAQ